MIDHIAARRLAATAIDGPLVASEATELVTHLADCPGCRAVSNALARDAATLAHLDFGPVPIAIRADIAIAAERGGRGSPVGRWIGLVAVGALLILALGGGALSGLGGQGTADPDDANVLTNPILWQNGVVDVQASDLWIQTAAGRVPAGGPPPTVRADVDRNSRILEALWQGAGKDVVLRLVLVDIEGAWWVKGVQVSDGATSGMRDTQGPFVGASIGDGQVGDVDLDIIDTTRTPAPVIGHVHIADLALRVAPTAGIDPNMPAPAQPGVKPANPIALIRCSGLLQRTPREVADTLAGLGYAVSWTIQRTGPNGEVSTSSTTEVPEGIVTSEPTFGADGVLRITVAPPGDPAAKPVELPADCPPMDPNVTPPVPVATDAVG